MAPGAKNDFKLTTKKAMDWGKWSQKQKKQAHTCEILVEFWSGKRREKRKQERKKLEFLGFRS